MEIPSFKNDYYTGTIMSLMEFSLLQAGLMVSRSAACRARYKKAIETSERLTNSLANYRERVKAAFAEEKGE